MLMLCLGIACIRVHSVKAFQSRHQKVAWFARYLFYGFRLQQNDHYGKSPITRRPDDRRLPGWNDYAVRVMAWLWQVRNRCTERRGCQCTGWKHVLNLPLEPDGTCRWFPDLYHRSYCKYSGHYQRHDAYAPCGRDCPLSASRNSRKWQEAVSFFTARKRMDLYREQTLEGWYDTDNLQAENTPEISGCVQELNVFKSFQRSKCERPFGFWTKKRGMKICFRKYFCYLFYWISNIYYCFNRKQFR